MSWQLQTMAQIMDKLLYQLAIMRDLAGGERELEYRIVDKGKLKTYNFESLGEEVIDTPIGRFDSIPSNCGVRAISGAPRSGARVSYANLPVRVIIRVKTGTLPLPSLSVFADCKKLDRPHRPRISGTGA